MNKRKANVEKWKETLTAWSEAVVEVEKHRQSLGAFKEQSGIGLTEKNNGVLY